MIMVILPIHQIRNSEAKDETQRNLAQGDLLEKFNHDTTSFPLLGRHRGLQCTQCHLGGRYKSLPTVCETCHNGQITYGKPRNHVMTSQNCDVCHGVSGWSPATFRHDLSMVTGQCIQCHNGQKAIGKPQNHISTALQCDSCHRVTGWTPAGFRHDPAMVTGRCSTCHNGQQVMGKPQNHVSTTQECDTCHRVTAWAPAMFVNHDNPRLIGGHQRLDCRVCHTQNFSSAFYRDGTQFGFCANCHTRDYKFPGPGDHRNNRATGTPFASMQDSLRANAMCSNCHKHSDYRGF